MMRRQGTPGEVQQQGKQVRHGATHREHQGARVRGLHAYVLPRAFAFVKTLRILQRVEHLRVLAAEARMQHAAEGVGEILRRNGASIAPAGLAQAESPDSGVFIPLPALGHAGEHAGVVLGVRAHQTFQQGGDDFSIRHSRRLVGVQADGFLSVADNEEALLRGSLHAAALVPAPPDDKAEGKGEAPRCQPAQHARHCSTKIPPAQVPILSHCLIADGTKLPQRTCGPR